MIWGREDSEWPELVATTEEFLAEKARLGRTTSYTELNSVLHRRTGARPFDFSKDNERAAMGSLLGEVARSSCPWSEPSSRPSCSTSTRTTPEVGYRLAVELNLLTPKPTADQKLAFWAGQVKASYEYYA